VSADEARLGPVRDEVVAMFAAALGRSDADTDFFRAGGTSLRAARLLSDVRRRFGVRVPLAVLLENPNPTDLAVAVAARAEAAGLDDLG
jgi:phthiocerol/phenolphthiocerol synthesis type-I polyketide synthase E